MIIFKNVLRLALFIVIISPMVIMACEERPHYVVPGEQNVQLAVNVQCGQPHQVALSQESAHLSKLKIVLCQRPQSVQAAVDKAFERCKTASASDWLYKGNDHYYLFDLNEDKVIKNLAGKQGDDDIYLVDVGCGRGDWGRQAMSSILRFDEQYRNTKKHFHIFSVTGGKECSDLDRTEGNVTLHQFNNFKIENLDEEFIKRGYNLKNKVHLMVSSWTLRHLADPWGTLKRMYSLLTPQQGLLASNGFYFAFNDSGRVQSFPVTYSPNTPSWNILIPTSAIPLFRVYDAGRDVGQFLLMRNNQQELEIPLEYTGEIRQLEDDGYQCESSVVTVFKKGLIPKKVCLRLKREDQVEEIEQEDDMVDDPDFSTRYCAFCAQNNLASKNLYTYLKKQGLFSAYFI